MSDKIQVVELSDALRAFGQCLQQWVDDGMPQDDPEVLAIPFNIPADNVIELTEKSRAIFGDGHGDHYRTRLVSEWVAVDE